MTHRPLKLALLLAVFANPVASDTEVVVGSKAFTESVILGEVAALVIRERGIPARHQRQLGGTRILWNAILTGEIDVYAEYSGTLRQEILNHTAITDDELRHMVGNHGLLMTPALGFNNTYALGMQRQVAQELNIETISDLNKHQNLEFGFSNEFMDRADGWPGLQHRYQLHNAPVRGLDHDLAYRALAGGDIHVTDLYTTDAEIDYYQLRILRDDLNYFPEYQAVYLIRAESARRFTNLKPALDTLGGQIDNRTMVAMNATAKLRKVPESKVAADFLATLGIDAQAPRDNRWHRLVRHTREHLVLVLISLSAAIAIAIPLGIVAARHRRLGQFILSVTGIIQTIPALALLVFMIPLLGIGGPPALMALFLYSLLPIVRSTHAGLADISGPIQESAHALGLPSGARLRRIELPLAARSILSGIKTSAVINVGTATLGALIGAGGYGQPILTGIRLDDTGLILQGAVPAALLALAVQGLFEVAERYAIPRGLRLGHGTPRPST